MKMSLLDRLRGPLLVEAQDPLAPAAPEAPVPDPAALGTPPAEDPGAAAPDAPAEPGAELAPEGDKPEEDKDESPIVHWPTRLQDIANDIRDTLQVKVEISETTSKTVPIGNDPDLGYHIVGVVTFPEGTPPDIKEKLQGRTLQYSAYVSPDGELSSAINLFYTTTNPYEAKQEPTYHVDSNQYRIVS